jgi:hypothetical protein
MTSRASAPTGPSRSSRFRDRCERPARRGGRAPRARHHERGAAQPLVLAWQITAKWQYDPTFSTEYDPTFSTEIEVSFVAEGARDRTGQALGVFTTREAAEAFIREDPFVVHGVVARWTVVEWNEVLT